jgi:hypothetical protein
MYFHGVQCRISICTHIIERLNQMSEYIHGCAEFVINLSFFVVSMFKKIYSFSNLEIYNLLSRPAVTRQQLLQSS